MVLPYRRRPTLAKSVSCTVYFWTKTYSLLHSLTELEISYSYSLQPSFTSSVGKLLCTSSLPNYSFILLLLKIQRTCSIHNVQQSHRNHFVLGSITSTVLFLTVYSNCIKSAPGMAAYILLCNNCHQGFEAQALPLDAAAYLRKGTDRRIRGGVLYKYYMSIFSPVILRSEYEFIPLIKWIEKQVKY